MMQTAKYVFDHVSRTYSFEKIDKDVPPRGALGKAPTKKFLMIPILWLLKRYKKRKLLAKETRGRYFDSFKGYLGSKLKKNQFSKYCYFHL